MGLGIHPGRIIGIVLVTAGAAAGLWMGSTLDAAAIALTGFDQVVVFAAIVTALAGAYLIYLDASRRV
jgi:predicted phage tail protein